MTLYMTHDGLYGWKTESNAVRWFNSEYQAKLYGLVQLECNIDNDEEVNAYMREFNLALDTMREKNHTKAEFGILGHFMFTVEEDKEEQ